MFGLMCHLVPSTWWSVWLIYMIVFRRYWLKGFVIELWQQLALGVTFYGSLGVVLLGGQDLGPPFIKRIMFNFELLLFLFRLRAVAMSCRLKRSCSRGSSGTMKSSSPRLTSSSEVGK